MQPIMEHFVLYFILIKESSLKNFMAELSGGKQNTAYWCKRINQSETITKI